MRSAYETTGKRKVCTRAYVYNVSGDEAANQRLCQRKNACACELKIKFNETQTQQQ